MPAEAVSTAGPVHEQEDLREEVDNPIERLKLLSGSDDEIAKYLDAIEVTSPREREMLHEISRTRPLAQPDRFPQAHRNMVEALESLARHGWHGTRAGAHARPFRWFVRWGVSLVARYLVVSQIRTLSTRLQNLYGLREIQAIPGTQERRELRRARMDAERMVDALKRRSWRCLRSCSRWRCPSSPRWDARRAGSAARPSRRRSASSAC